MLPDRVSNPGPLTYESGALPIALRGRAGSYWNFKQILQKIRYTSVGLDSKGQSMTVD